MTSNISHQRKVPVQQVIDAAARATEAMLSVGHRALGRAELHVHAWRLGRDPQIVDWIADIEREAADGYLATQAVEPELLKKYISAERPAS